MIRFVENHAKTRRSMWLCLCECGKEGVVNSKDLRTGHSKSCGCLAKEITSLRSKKQDSGKRKLLRQYKQSAKYRNLTFALTDDEFTKLTTDDCFYCGVNPNRTIVKHSKDGSYLYNGIDRKNNKIGYTTDNSVTCCYECNFLKSDINYNEFKSMIVTIFNHRFKGET